METKYPHLARDPHTGAGGNWFSPNEQDLRRGFEGVGDLLTENLQPEVKLAKLQAHYQSVMNQISRIPVGAGEDVSFCHRAAACGHVPHVDMALFCGHLGDRVYGKTT